MLHSISFYFLLSIIHVASSLQGNRICVLLDSLYTRDIYSQFFGLLKDRGYQLTYSSADDSSLTIHQYKNYTCDHLILFTPTVEEFGGQVNNEVIREFIDNGGNVLVAASSDIGDPIRELAVDCGLEFDEAGTSVIDHFSFDAKDKGKHTLIWQDPKQLIDSTVIVGKIDKPILFQGVGLIKDPKNELILDILTADSTAFSFSPDAKTVSHYPHALGKDLLLVAATQARNNARVLFTGSIDMFSNKFFDSPVQDALTGKFYEKSGNRDLAIALSKWVFKETGVLRGGNVKHHKKDSKETPQAYTIMDDVIYSIDVETLDDKGKWVPYVSKDIQVEFVRVDPFIRTNLVPKGGTYMAEMKLPDVYGVYQFKVDYKREGYTYLYSMNQVSVRPFEHTQYERFIISAYPYYASAFIMMIMVYLFSFMILYDQDGKKTKSE